MSIKEHHSVSYLLDLNLPNTYNADSKVFPPSQLKKLDQLTFVAYVFEPILRLHVSCKLYIYVFIYRRSISAPQIDVLEDETLMVPQDYNMAMREVLFQIHRVHQTLQSSQMVNFDLFWSFDS